MMHLVNWWAIFYDCGSVCIPSVLLRASMGVQGDLNLHIPKNNVLAMVVQATEG